MSSQVTSRKRVSESYLTHTENQYILNFSMEMVRFVKSFSKGQITIPKELREALGILDEFWLRLSVQDGKIIAEPVEKKKDKSAYKAMLLQMKPIKIDVEEIKRNRVEIDKRVASRDL